MKVYLLYGSQLLRVTAPLYMTHNNFIIPFDLLLGIHDGINYFTVNEKFSKRNLSHFIITFSTFLEIL